MRKTILLFMIICTGLIVAKGQEPNDLATLPYADTHIESNGWTRANFASNAMYKKFTDEEFTRFLDSIGIKVGGTAENAELGKSNHLVKLNEEIYSINPQNKTVNVLNINKEIITFLASDDRSTESEKRTMLFHIDTLGNLHLSKTATSQQSQKLNEKIANQAINYTNNLPSLTARYDVFHIVDTAGFSLAWELKPIATTDFALFKPKNTNPALNPQKSSSKTTQQTSMLSATAAPAGATFDNPINIGVLNVGSVYQDNRTNSDEYLDNIGYISNDIYYKFTVSGTCSRALISVCSPDFPTHLIILNNTGGIYGYTVNRGRCNNSYPLYHLNPGTYYLVTEGASIYNEETSTFTGPINLKIEVEPIPSVPAPVITSSSATLCVNGNITLKTANNSYVNWYKNGASMNEYRRSIRIYQPGNYQAAVTNSCGDRVFSDTISITQGTSTTSVPDKPTITANGSTHLCTNSNVTLSATGENIKWYQYGYLVGENSTIKVYNAGTYTATSSNECGESIADTIIITKEYLPINIQRSTYCATLSTTLTQNLQWYSNGIPIPGATGQTFNIDITTWNYFHVSSTDSCGHVFTSGSVSILYPEPPKPTIYVQGENGKQCYPPGTRLYADRAAKWYLNGNEVHYGIDIVTSNAGQYTARYVYDCRLSKPSNAILVYEPIYLVKQSRFDHVSQKFTASDPQAVVNDLHSQITNQVTTSCESQADNWMQALGEELSAYPQSIQETLRTKLIEICVAGGDIDHPMGSSTTPSGVASASGYTNFGQVLKSVLGLSAFSDTLNPWLLDAPYPHEVKQQSVAKTLGATTDAICTRLTQLQQQHTASQPGVSFYAYLVAIYGQAINLNEEELDLLLKSCNNCRYLLERAVPLPVFMEPGTQGCITGADLSAATNALQAAFTNGLSSTHANYETIYANFMNHRWGFSMSYDQYMGYQAGLSANPNAILCNKPPYTTIASDPYECIKEQMAVAVANGKREYAAYLQEEKDKFRGNYVSVCSAAKANVLLTAEQQVYHYTLYYYDQADNLVRTVPPEGVALLGDEEIGWVQQARAMQGQQACAYQGPEVNANKATALQDLSTVLSASAGRAIEMWLYNPNTTGNQILATTPDKKFMVQSCINGNLLNVDIYTLTAESSTSISFIKSNHATVDISSINPLYTWTHIVIQGNSLAAGPLQLYINGKTAPMVAGAPPAGCGWEVTSTGGTVNMPENLSTLKHMRFYNRLMTAAEIAANAKDGCFNIGPEVQPALQPNLIAWHRFNVPAPETTIAANSTQEQLVNPFYPAHGLTTTYAYNSTNQVTQQLSPDGGASYFWYDMLSRLAVSQNAKQREGNKFGYTAYDALGRISEVGEKASSTAGLTVPDYLSTTAYNNFLSSGTNSQITQTYYDQPATGSGIPTGLVQDNLRKRVSASVYRETPTSIAINASYYHYDLAGNVKDLYQQVNGLGIKKIGYEYDLISGKVNFVSYQHGQPDQFYYQYGYDAENRLTDAWSAVNASINSYGRGSSLTDPSRRLDAHYEYYLHGPMARLELGDVYGKVQGMDYAYTLQGWLKGVNSTQLNQSQDVGQDGNVIAKDALAYSLGYYNGDYKSIGGSSNPSFTAQYQEQAGDITGQSLYNGNISNATYAISQIGNGNPVGYTYRYDQLNRLKQMRQHTISGSGNWNSSSLTSKYSESFNYDGNGNILSLQRNSAAGQMDNLAYSYNRNSGKLADNKLQQLTDAIPGSTQAGELSGTSNYTYDPTGNIIADSKEGISAIDWSVYGKIKSISKSNGNINYFYDASGNRVSKTAGGITTYYIRDAQGNTLGLYDNKTGTLNWREQQLYGSSRLGMWKPDINLSNDNASTVWDTIGKKTYELTNHLGNVMAVISDKRTLNGSTYEVDVLSAQDYYAFGSLMPGRTYTAPNSNYRYGFNGKENDSEVKGEGNQQDYGIRIYDPRLGRFLSVDPLAEKMSAWSPYSFCFNNPLSFVDLDGAIPTPVEGAKIANHIYAGKVGDVVAGWTLNKVYTSENNSAFHSGLYSRTVNGVTEYTMANAGTYFENSKRGRGSMSEDVEQPFGGSENMRLSISTAKRVSEQVGDAELTFVGHSKGGAEAAGNALATNRNALLYNPAAINSEAYGLDKKSYTGADKNGMTAYIVKGDMLDTFINSWSAKPIDKAIYLPNQSSNPVTNHSMDSMFKALNEYLKNNEQKK